MDAVAERGLDLLRRDQVLIDERLSSTLTRSLPAPSWRTRSTSRCALRIDGTSGLVTRKIVSAAYNAAAVQALITLPASMTT